MNDMIVDSDNVLLLQPLDPQQGVAVLSAVDPVNEPGGAQGVVVAQIFALQRDNIKIFAERAKQTFAAYQAAGAREAGILATLDVSNNFPQLPIRTDGPFLVWLGILKDNRAFEDRLHPLMEQASQSLPATGLLRSSPELIVLDPAARSRMRWLPDWQ